MPRQHGNLVNDFETTAVAIIKHTNPAGVGLGQTPSEAYQKALATDPLSAFGGIVAFNCRVDADAAEEVIKIFTEVVIAPDFDPAALEILKAKKNLRVLCIDPSNESGVGIQADQRRDVGANTRRSSTQQSRPQSCYTKTAVRRRNRSVVICLDSL